MFLVLIDAARRITNLDCSMSEVRAGGRLQSTLDARAHNRWAETTKRSSKKMYTSWSVRTFTLYCGRERRLGMLPRKTVKAGDGEVGRTLILLWTHLFINKHPDLVTKFPTSKGSSLEA